MGCAVSGHISGLSNLLMRSVTTNVETNCGRRLRIADTTINKLGLESLGEKSQGFAFHSQWKPFLSK